VQSVSQTCNLNQTYAGIHSGTAGGTTKSSTIQNAVKLVYKLHSKLQKCNGMTYLRNPASTMNWPFGFQNRWFTERFSSVSAKTFLTGITNIKRPMFTRA